MKVTELQFDDSLRAHVPGAAKEGAAIVGVAATDSPLSIVEAINGFVAKPPKRGWFEKVDNKVDNWNDRALPVGALWATQMERRFGWEWVNTIQHDHNDFKVVGVFDKERRLGIYPFHYVFGCLENGVYPTILLAFNMLVAGDIPRFEPLAYVNLMNGVRHIVPPR
jgi:hypothetical protein